MGTISQTESPLSAAVAASGAKVARYVVPLTDLSLADTGVAGDRHRDPARRPDGHRRRDRRACGAPGVSPAGVQGIEPLGFLAEAVTATGALAAAERLGVLERLDRGPADAAALVADCGLAARSPCTRWGCSPAPAAARSTPSPPTSSGSWRPA